MVATLFNFSSSSCKRLRSFCFSARCVIQLVSRSREHVLRTFLEGLVLLFMDSNYGVVVYQPERTDCTKCSSPLDSVEVARNLLSGDEDCRKFTTVSSTGFKPWYGEYLTLHGHQFYPWSKFCLPLFQIDYLTLPNPKTKENKV